MFDGDFLIRWTVRLALACYVAALAGRICQPQRLGPRLAVEAVWTLGCLWFWAHVWAAFAYYHHWSHAHAFANTAEQTKSLLGWEFGYGIYFSYLFAALWTADIVVGWLSLARQRDPARWRRLALHAYLLFIALNGAVIFHSGPIRWVGLTCLTAVAALAALKWIRKPRITNHEIPMTN